MSASQRHVWRFAAIFASGTMLSRVFGLVRDVLIAQYIPAASRDAFLFAFRLPNMLRDMLGEGAANAAFVPVFSESQERDTPERYRALVSACFSAMLLLFSALTVLGILLMPLIPHAIEWLRPITGGDAKAAAQWAETVLLLQWTFPYLLFIGLAVFATAPLFTAGHYSTPSWSPVLLNLALIGACLAGNRFFADPVWALVAGVWIGGIAQLAVMFAAMRRRVGVIWPNFRLREPGVAKAFWLLSPVILGQAAGEVNKLVNSFFAYSLEDGTVSALFFADRLVQLPLAIFGIAVSVAILPGLSRAGARGAHGEIRETLQSGLRQTAFLIVPAMAVLIALGEPLVRLLFQRGAFDDADAVRTATALVYYAAGLASFAGVKVCVQGFYAAQNTRTPVIIASACMLMNIALNVTLVGPLGFRGLALATTLSYTLNFAWLFVLLSRKYGALWDGAFLSALARIAAASLIAGAVAWFVYGQAAGVIGGEGFVLRGAAVSAALASAGAIYMGLSLAFRLSEAAALLDLVRRRAR